MLKKWILNDRLALFILINGIINTIFAMLGFFLK